MGLLSEIFNIVCKRHNVDDKSLYVFYKIVDSVQDGEKYILQCINTSALFHAALTDIVFDIDLLYGLHPIQACYVGLEFSKFLKKSNGHSEIQQNQKEKENKYSICRYGNYQISYQDRKGNVSFVNNKTGRKHF